MRTAAFALAAALAAVASSPSHATSTALVVAIDTSGSIDATEFDLQRAAYANFFSDNAAGFADADVSVTVLYWAGNGVQQQVVPWTTLSSANDATAFATAILATSRPDISGAGAAQTGVARALDSAVALFGQGQHAVGGCADRPRVRPSHAARVLLLAHHRLTGCTHAAADRRQRLHCAGARREDLAEALARARHPGA